MASVLTALIPPSGLVSWWPGDGSTIDIAGASNGTFQGTAQYYSSGKVDAAFWFNGTSNYVDIPSMNLGSTFTVEFWMYPTGGGSYQHLVSNTSSSSNYGALYYYPSSYVYFYQGGTNRMATPANSVTYNTWSHIALTYDGSVSRLYVNGALQATSSAFSMTFNNALRLGYSTNNSDSRFSGLLDEVSLYNRALSVEEILAIYNSGSNGKTKP